MKKSRLYLLALLIAAVGLGGFFYKWKVLHFPVQPVAETEVCELQARVEFQPRRGPNKVTLQLPFEPPGFAILDERFVARNYGMTIERAKGAREVQWAIRRASGTQALYYRATVYRDEHREAAAPKAPPRAQARHLGRALRDRAQRAARAGPRRVGRQRHLRRGAGAAARRHAALAGGAIAARGRATPSSSAPNSRSRCWPTGSSPRAWPAGLPLAESSSSVAAAPAAAGLRPRHRAVDHDRRPHRQHRLARRHHALEHRAASRCWRSTTTRARSVEFSVQTQPRRRAGDRQAAARGPGPQLHRLLAARPAAAGAGGLPHPAAGADRRLHHADPAQPGRHQDLRHLHAGADRAGLQLDRHGRRRRCCSPP